VFLSNRSAFDVGPLTLKRKSLIVVIEVPLCHFAAIFSNPGGIMQILVLSGSRNRQGKTAQAIDALCKGASAAGAGIEQIFLPEKNLERCRQCNPDGWGICRTEHRCIIEDDFVPIVEKIKAADAMIIATPVYFADLSDSLRGFLDRLRRIRFMGGGPPVAGRPPAAQAGTPAIGLCYAGGSGYGTISCAFNLERILQTCGFDILDMIPVRRQNIDMKIPLLEIEGHWLVTRKVA
jgi:NAD(P)H-dependent FMN reductase